MTMTELREHDKRTFNQRYRHYDNRESLAEHPGRELQFFVEDVQTGGHFSIPGPNHVGSDAYYRNWAYREYKRHKQLCAGEFSPRNYLIEYFVDWICQTVFEWTNGKINITPKPKGKQC